jgi:pimeloyl-ACP methyl ester carboxylesterase
MNAWRSIAEDLAPLTRDRTVVFHDYRGGGDSATAPPETYTFERLAADVDALRAHLGHDRIDVLAHSMGGFVALHYVTAHPDRVRRLVLVGVTPVARLGAMAGPTLRALGPARTAEAVGRGLWYLAAWSWRPASREKMRRANAVMATMQAPRRPLRRPLEERFERLGLPVANDNAGRLMREIGQTDLRDRLGRITCPTLVLHGSRDATMVAAAGYLTAGLPDVRHVILPGIGHEPFWEAPGATTAEVKAFLDAV